MPVDCRLNVLKETSPNNGWSVTVCVNNGNNPGHLFLISYNKDTSVMV